MKAKRKDWGTLDELDTPYKRARQEWDDRMGSTLTQAKNWRLLAFSSILFVALPCVGGLIYLGAQPKSVPHIIELHGDGSARYRGEIGKAWEQYTPSTASIRYHLHRFINATRSLSSDRAVLKQNWFDAYKLVTDKASNKLSTYVRQDDPFQRAASQRVGIEVINTLSISPETWQVDWREQVWGAKGNLLTTEHWRGIFTISIRKPETPTDMDSNPIGLFIDEFDWSRISG